MTAGGAGAPVAPPSAVTVGAPRRFRFAPILAATVLTVLLLWMVGSVADVFLLLFIAILLSLYLGAVADAIARRTRLPRKLALGVSVMITLAAIAGLFWLLVPPVVEQTQALVRVLPSYITALDARIEELVRRVPALSGVWRPGEHQALEALYAQGAPLFENVVPKVFSVVHGAIDVFAVGVMSLYLAMQPGLYREWLIALFPPVHRELIRDVLGEVASTLRSWIVGQLTAMFVLAVMTAIGLYLLDVPYWLTFGVFTGVVAIVPFFGTLVSTLLPALFVLAMPNGFTRALLVALLGVVIHLIEGNFVAPYIHSKRVELPPVLSIMAVLVAGRVLGPIGLIVAVPTLAMIMVVVRRILINRVYEGQGFRRSTRDQPLVLRVPPADGEGVLVPAAPAVDLIALAERARRTA